MIAASETHLEHGWPRFAIAALETSACATTSTTPCDFAHDLTVPFTGNQAERDLRMIEVQLEISGSWRIRRGSAFAPTAQPSPRNDIHILTEPRNAITGNP
ncbi:hypothetical protein [Amycolatopsis minnesotensis]|uniref:Uncharacterized protein n=1 Tax=Amycolatopsis minnesotensis TaxID=337894 RepID=A0ABN2R038_9PSEU